MVNDEFDEVDLRYLQCKEFIPGDLEDWTRPRNIFTARTAANLQPDFAVELDFEVAVELLGGAAHARPGWVINVGLQLQGEKVSMVVFSIERGMPSIYSDDAGSLLSALHWYRAQGDTWLRVSVITPSWFWLPLHLLARDSLVEGGYSKQ